MIKPYEQVYSFPCCLEEPLDLIWAICTMIEFHMGCLIRNLQYSSFVLLNPLKYFDSVRYWQNRGRLLPGLADKVCQGLEHCHFNRNICFLMDIGEDRILGCGTGLKTGSCNDFAILSGHYLSLIHI